jgi:hypothetical protein
MAGYFPDSPRINSYNFSLVLSRNNITTNDILESGLLQKNSHVFLHYVKNNIEQQVKEETNGTATKCFDLSGSSVC